MARTARPHLPASALVAAAFAALAVVPPAAAASYDDAVLGQLNFARSHPAAYAEQLRRYRQAFDGQVVRESGYGPGVMTIEGVAAVDEAIAFLERQRPLAPLSRNAALALAADDHARAQGAEGGFGHVDYGRVGPGERIARHAVWSGMVAEDISYGQAGPAEVVRQLIVDDGVRNRGHRTNIFNPYLGYAGVGCGPHRVYRAMCVIDFASGFGAPKE